MPPSDSQTTRVLTIGNDVSQLSSRANLLIHAGYNVDLEVNVERALRRLRVHPYHLVILSGKLSHDEQIGIRAQLRQVRSDQRVLLLSEREDGADGLLESVASSLRHNR